MNRTSWHRVLLLAAICLAALAGCRREQWDYTPSTTAVRTEIARSAPFRSSLVLFGEVRASGSIPIRAPRSGTISYPPRFASGLRTGELVRAAETLAAIENESTRLALAEARIRARAADAELLRVRKGFEGGLYSQADLAHHERESRLEKERLASAGREARRLAVAAPRAGQLVVTQSIPAGSIVADGALLAELSVGGVPRVEAVAAAADREALRPGLPVAVFLPGKDEPLGSGTLSEVASSIDAAGTIRVVAELAPAALVPPPGEAVELRVELAAKSDVLSVPEEALIAGEGGSALFIAERSSEWANFLRVKRVAVETGARGGGRVEISRGLRDRDRVVVSGVAFLSDGGLVTEPAPEKSPDPRKTAK